jgi:predicted PurR-regulated permease PerM
VHPFVVLVSVLFGATLLGVLGALVAIPIAASIDILIQEWWMYRQEQKQLEQLRVAIPES